MMTDTDRSELQALSAIVGAPVVTFERAAWGFENRTDIVTLADGRRLVVQRLAKWMRAPRSLRLAQLLPDRLAPIGVRLPRQLAADATADPPYAVREHLPGVPAAAFMGDDAGAIAVASAMGALLPLLQLAPTAGLRLPSSWADAARLEQLARRQLDRCRELFDEAIRRELAATIDEVRARFAGRSSCFAHGDFCPVNALAELDQGRTTEDEGDELRRSSLVLRQTEIESGGIRVIALLDVDYARVADPLFDAAWWGWVVRYHHPERWAAAWPALLRTASIVADEATQGHVRVLQRLRCLEAVDDARRAGIDAAAAWAQRLRETLDWSYEL
jgi:aminoglycoside phosphotransferase (APT) family kinase protein